MQHLHVGRLREDRKLPVPDRFGICRTVLFGENRTFIGPKQI